MYKRINMYHPDVYIGWTAPHGQQPGTPILVDIVQDNSLQLQK